MQLLESSNLGPLGEMNHSNVPYTMRHMHNYITHETR